MIGDAPFVEIVGADALASVARAHLRAAVAGIGRVLFLLQFFVKPRAQNAHRLFLVLELAFFVLTGHDDAAGNVRDTHGAVRLVDVLPAVAGRTVDVDAQVVGVDFHVNLLRLGQHGDRRGGGLPLAVALRHRDALNAVHAALVFQAAERALPRDGENRLLHAAQLGHAGLQHLGLPAVPLGVSHVHPHQHRAEQRRFLAARAAADFHHNVPLRVRVFGQKQKLNFAPGRRQPVLKLGQLLLRHFGHVGVIEQRARLLLRVL